MAGLWGNIFAAVLGGIANSSQQRSSERATREATQEAGRQDRSTSSFNADQEYYYNQLLRDERRQGLDTGYNQFSTIRNFAPNYTAPTGVTVPVKPKPGDY